jgi:hypothetical protein
MQVFEMAQRWLHSRSFGDKIIVRDEQLAVFAGERVAEQGHRRFYAAPERKKPFPPV